MDNERLRKDRSASANTLFDAKELNLGQFVDRAIDHFGRYQKCIVIVLCINSIVVAINHTVTAFHVYTPANFTCADSSYEVNIVKKLLMRPSDEPLKIPQAM